MACGPDRAATACIVVLGIAVLGLQVETLCGRGRRIAQPPPASLGHSSQG